MGYFAVLRTKPTNKQQFRVERCHLNFWSLAGFPTGHFVRLYFFDVGLLLANESDDDLSEFNLALPFFTGDGFFHDLYDEVREEKTARLIFGRDIEVRGDKMTLKNRTKGTSEECDIAAVSVAKSKRLPEFSNKLRSVWTINPVKSLEKGKKAYLRFRFEILGLGRTFLPTSMYKGGVLDFRIADIREAVGLDHWRDLHDTVVPIQALNLFCIAPANLVPRLMSPKPYYMRLYEGSIWNDYLRRAFKNEPHEKMIIYQWRNPIDENGQPKSVSTDAPFRILFSVSQEASPFRIRHGILIVLITAAIILFAEELKTSASWKALLSFAKTQILSVLAHWIQTLAAVGFLGICTLAIKYRKIPKAVTSWWTWLQTKYRKAQFWYFRYRL